MLIVSLNAITVSIDIGRSLSYQRKLAHFECYRKENGSTPKDLCNIAISVLIELVYCTGHCQFATFAQAYKNELNE